MVWFVFLEKKSAVWKRLNRGGQVLCSLCLLLLFTSCSGAVSQAPPLSGHLLIVGSTALQPLTTKAAEMFEKQYPHTHIVVEGGGSFVGLNAITSQQADIGQSDVYADPIRYPDPNLTDHIVCIVPFTMIVNPDVDISTLSQQQIIDIYVTGTLQNWQKVGGPDLPIVPVIRSDLSGTRASFQRYVLNGNTERQHLLSGQESKDVLALVASHPGAIGYIALSALNPHLVHTVAINGVPAKPEAIANGTYAFWGYEHMYTMSTEHSDLLAAFLAFMLTTPIQDLASSMGYIPLNQIQFPTQTVTG